MTSNHLFYKSIKEDLRHRIWLIALSFLGSFLSLPVTWLLAYGDSGYMLSDISVAESQQWSSMVVNRVAGFYQEELMIGAGLIAMIGAIIVGLESFRYLQQKSMVDTYHSLPISRNQLFFVKYINGVLIWLLPYLFCLTVTFILSCVYMVRLRVSGGIGMLLWEALKSSGVLLVIYLLIYHLFLFATMLTGSVLNTLVVAAILGGGIISAYGLMLGFMSTYFHSFYTEGQGLSTAFCGSPLAAAFYLMVSRVNGEILLAENYTLMLLLILVVALLLGVLAWRTYVGRASERAGRGLDQKWVSAFLRALVSILGGMSGWLFMYYLKDGGDDAATICWCIFGALLTAGLVYGALDVIFSLDFKAFFRHRWGMAGSVAVALLICFGFVWDWAGYDRYLPKEEQIKEATIYSRAYTNNNTSVAMRQLQAITDEALIRNFLERGIENLQGKPHKPVNIQTEEMYVGDSHAVEPFYVRVTLENGRSYYREYFYYEWDEDVVLPLLCSEAYAHSSYYISDEMLENCYSMKFASGYHNGGAVTVENERVFREVAEGYNQDLLAHPREVILGEGKLVGRISMQMSASPSRVEINLYDHMTHTLAAIADNGIEIIDQPFLAQEVESITLHVEGDNYRAENEKMLVEEAEQTIRSHFGVYPESLSQEIQDQTDAQNGLLSDKEEAEPAAEIQLDTEQSVIPKEVDIYSIMITDFAEIEELLPLIQYDRMYRGSGVFTKGLTGGICILDQYGVEWEVKIRMGALPEKYIQRLLETVQ